MQRLSGRLYNVGGGRLQESNHMGFLRSRHIYSIVDNLSHAI